MLGALDDGALRASLRQGRSLIAANVGNFHTLAMRLSPRPGGVAIDGVFEHHTGELTRDSLTHFLEALADGTIDGEEVFRTMGHGALLSVRGAAHAAMLSVTGPRRSLLGRGPAGRLGVPRLAVPHADMMQTGPFGLLRALAHHVPRWREPIERRLGPAATEATT